MATPFLPRQSTVRSSTYFLPPSPPAALFVYRFSGSRGDLALCPRLNSRLGFVPSSVSTVPRSQLCSGLPKVGLGARTAAALLPTAARTRALRRMRTECGGSGSVTSSLYVLCARTGCTDATVLRGRDGGVRWRDARARCPRASLAAAVRSGRRRSRISRIVAKVSRAAPFFRPNWRYGWLHSGPLRTVFEED